ncbi:unnamed protein product [Caenorhabditis nigoni]
MLTQVMPKNINFWHLAALESLSSAAEQPENKEILEEVEKPMRSHEQPRGLQSPRSRTRKVNNRSTVPPACRHVFRKTDLVLPPVPICSICDAKAIGKERKYLGLAMYQSQTSTGPN